MSEHVIEIHEEEVAQAESRMDTLVVRGEQVLDTLKSLLADVTVRRVIVKRRDGRKILDIPLVAGVAGTFVFWAWMPIPVITALLFECSIIVERRDKGLKQGVKPDQVKPMREEEVAEGTEVMEEMMVVETAAATANDLTRINGIGPKVASLLNESGIRTFAQLAQTDVTTLQVILEKAGARYRLIDPTTWPEQAEQLG
jgi:predicted flap endonuclease-1-like 5' DNA nuclease